MKLIENCMPDLLCLLPVPALAGDWVEVNSGSADLQAITYRSEKMLPGEEAPLTYTGTDYDYDIANGEDDFFDRNSIFLSLRVDVEGDDLIDLFVPEGGFLGPPCGAHTLAALDEYNDRPEVCAAACYQTFDDLRNDRGGLDCAQGTGRWIAAVVIGKLVHNERPWTPPDTNDAQYNEKTGLYQIWKNEEEQRIRDGRPIFAEKVRAANYLIVEATTSERHLTSVPLDGTFRTAFWNPEP